MPVAKTVFVRQGAHSCFFHAAQGQKRVRQLLLRQAIQHIALIFGRIQSFFQKKSAVFGAFNAGIMPGDDMRAAELLRALIQLFELQVAIAVNAGVGRFSVFIGMHKAVDHAAFKAVGKIEDMVGHAELFRDGTRVLHIIQRAAAVFTRETERVVCKQLHGNADTVESRLAAQIGGNTGIHTAAHGNDNFFRHGASPFKKER